MRNAIKTAVLAALLATIAPNPVRATLHGHACEGSVSPGSVFKQVGNDVLENLMFAEGSLWVSDASTSSIRRFAPDGSEGAGLSGIPSPGGLARHPTSGLIYAGWGNGAANALQRNGAAKIVRFSAADPAGTLEVVAQGLNMANGVVFGPGLQPDLYTSNDFDSGLVKVPAANPAAWTTIASDVWGMNGLALSADGTALYAAITFDQRAPIARVPLDGSPSTIVAQGAFGVASLEPALYGEPDGSNGFNGVRGLDDMMREPETGHLFVAANGSGELLRADPASGDVCIVASGLQNASSVRLAPAGSAFDTSGERFTFYTTGFDGAIRVVGFTPA